MTGYAFSVDELKMLLINAEKFGILVVLDETYADFAPIDATPLLDEFNNLVIIRSFSKNIGLAGLRIGYIVTTEYLSEIIEKFKPMMEINSLSVLAVKYVCSDCDLIKNEVAKVINTRHTFATALNNLGFDVIEKDGNFVLVNFGVWKEKVMEKLVDNNIEFKKLPMPLNNYIRFTIATDEIMQNVVKLISLLYSPK